MKHLIIIGILLAALPLCGYLFIAFLYLRRLHKQSFATDGTVHTTDASKRAAVTYEVDHKTYRKTYSKRAFCSLKNGDIVPVYYSEHAPRFALVQSCELMVPKAGELLLLMVFLAAAALCVILAFLLPEHDHVNGIYMLILGVVFLAICACAMLEESRYKKCSEKADGTLHVLYEKGKVITMIAVFSVNGRIYYTKEYKSSSAGMKPGDPVPVLFDPANPYYAVIAEDKT